jgi:galactose-1-phosphate uridylyltransferase
MLNQIGNEKPQQDDVNDHNDQDQAQSQTALNGGWILQKLERNARSTAARISSNINDGVGTPVKRVVQHAGIVVLVHPHAEAKKYVTQTIFRSCVLLVQGRSD